MPAEPVQFATVEDLQARWLDLPPGQDERVNILLQDASQFILDTVPQAAHVSPSTLRRITCAVTRRYMESETAVTRGLSQTAFATGPFSQTQHYANPDGAFYLRGDEKTALGRRRQRAATIDLLGHLEA